MSTNRITLTRLRVQQHDKPLDNTSMDQTSALGDQGEILPPKELLERTAAWAASTARPKQGNAREKDLPPKELLDRTAAWAARTAHPVGQNESLRSRILSKVCCLLITSLLPAAGFLSAMHYGSPSALANHDSNWVALVDEKTSQTLWPLTFREVLSVNGPWGTH